MNISTQGGMAVDNFCQSCGMPMDKPELFGSQADGKVAADYCVYCYKFGNFTQPDLTLQAMIDACIPHLQQHGMNETTARRLLNEHLPKLKRWSNC